MKGGNYRRPYAYIFPCLKMMKVPISVCFHFVFLSPSLSFSVPPCRVCRNKIRGFYIHIYVLVHVTGDGNRASGHNRAEFIWQRCCYSFFLLGSIGNWVLDFLFTKLTVLHFICNVLLSIVVINSRDDQRFNL